MRYFLTFMAVFGLSNVAYSADLDEFDLPYARQPLENVTTGGQPSIEDLKRFSGDGYTLIVNLRVPGEFEDFEEGEEAEKVGLKYINIPVKGMKGLTPENAEALHAAIEGAGGKVFVHCTIGMRAGGLLGLEGYLYHDLSADEAVDLARAAHMDHVEEAIGEAIKRLDD